MFDFNLLKAESLLILVDDISFSEALNILYSFKKWYNEMVPGVLRYRVDFQMLEAPEEDDIDLDDY